MKNLIIGSWRVYKANLWKSKWNYNSLIKTYKEKQRLVQTKNLSLTRAKLGIPIALTLQKK